MKVLSIACVLAGLTAAAFAQQDRFPTPQPRSQFESSAAREIAEIPQPPLPPQRYSQMFGTDRTLANVQGITSWVTRSDRQDKETVKASREVEKAIAKLKESDAGPARQAAQKLVEQKLSELFDLKTKSREEQISALEKRLVEMRSQLEKRADQKNDIVRLRLQTLVNDANGLSF